MSLIQTPWTSQPQQAVGVDFQWSPASAWNFSTPIDAVSGKQIVFNSSWSRSIKGEVGLSVSGTSVLNRVQLQSDLSAISFGAGDFTVAVTFILGGNTGGYSAFGRWNTGGSPATNDWFVGAGSSFDTATADFVVASGSTVYTASCSGAWTVGNKYTIIGRRRGTTIFVDRYNHTTGVWSSGSTTNAGITSINYNSSRKTKLGEIDAGSAYNISGTYFSASTFNRCISDAEVRAYFNNPWQIFKPLPRRIFAPVATGGDPTLYPSLYTNTNSFYAPTVSVGSVTLTPSLFSNSNTFHSATVTLGGATQTLTPSLYSNTNTFHAPSVTTGAVTLTPSLVTNTNSLFGAVVTLDSDKILYPSLVSNSNSFYGPTVSVGAVSLLPSLFVNSNTFYNHVVGGALTDSEKIDLILDILSNRQTLDATTGIYTLYADDGVTVMKTAQAWEDSEGTQPYRGRGLKRLDALQ